MKKTIIFTALLALIALTGQAKVLASTLPADWFVTDSVTIRGHIEDYDAERFGFSAMECSLCDVMAENGVLSMCINPDGSFEKRFLLSYPMKLSFRASDESRIGFNELLFFARPGDIVDVTVRKNDYGKYECFYADGSNSKDVERWLKADLQLEELVTPLLACQGNFAEANQVADETWQNMTDRFQAVSRRERFTPFETQLAMAEMQCLFALAYMDYAFYRELALSKQELRDGIYYTEILDSTEWAMLSDHKNYTALRHVDLNNPLLLTNNGFYILISRIQYANDALRTMLETGKGNLTLQLCAYKNLKDYFNSWRQNEEKAEERLADPAMAKWGGQDLPILSKMYPPYLAALTHPYIHQKAEQFYVAKMAQSEFAMPLPDTPTADLIRRLCAKYPGRYLVLDFWGMDCGPCRAAIQQSKDKRAEIAKRDDVKLVFIAEERTAEGSDSYRKYVSEWLADEETVCLDRADFCRLQELFHFTAIPHYETITPDCRRVRDDLSISSFYNFDYELQKIEEKLRQ